MKIDSSNIDNINKTLKNIRNNLESMIGSLHILKETAGCTDREITNIKCAIWNALVTENMDVASELEYRKGENENGRK